MPNRGTHTLIGAIGGALASYIAEPQLRGSDRFWNVVGGALGGAIGGRLPDMLEPATNPNHRQFAHGVLPAIGVTVATKNMRRKARDKARSWANQAHTPSASRALRVGESGPPRELRFVALGALRGLETGYASHLAADALTPKGLPLVGRL